MELGIVGRQIHDPYSLRQSRINFLPEKRRKAAVAEMIDHARSKGVKLTRPALGVTL